MQERKQSMWLWYFAFLYAAGFLLLTGLVPDWGSWYSEKIHYREQTEAFFQGSLALESTPYAMRNDLVWHDGRVQQVWGLGVPAWRFPFECLAKLTGMGMFPDRFCFGAALMLFGFFTLKTMLRVVGETSASNALFLAIVASSVLLLFPPFVTLCHFRFDVYEEAVAYGYICGVCLFLAVLAFAKKPTLSKYILTSGFAGLVPFVRPTLGAHAVATMAILVILAWRARFSWYQQFAAVSCFCVGGLLLSFSNYIRFGGAFEFGHNLNLNGFPIWFYGRFCNPLAKEPLMAVSRELFGVTFCSPILNEFDWMRPQLCWGQCSAPRFRNFYATTFDFSHLFILLGTWVSCLWSLIWRHRRRWQLAQEAILAGIWSVIGILLLAGFYLRTPFISNRYILDFGPEMAVASAGLLLGCQLLVAKSNQKPFWYYCLPGVTILWLVVEFFQARTTSRPTPAISKAEVRLKLAARYRRSEDLPNSYQVGDDLEQYGILYNGSGWDPNGCMPSMVPFFISDPEFLRLEVSRVDTNRPIDYSKLRAKIGLEYLAVASIAETPTNCVITLNAPTRSVYRRGVQNLFIAYVDETEFATNGSPLKLLRLQWKGNKMF
jgi:hypothetical protein